MKKALFFAVIGCLLVSLIIYSCSSSREENTRRTEEFIRRQPNILDLNISNRESDLEKEIKNTYTVIQIDQPIDSLNIQTILVKRGDGPIYRAILDPGSKVVIEQEVEIIWLEYVHGILGHKRDLYIARNK